jgi:hypothetical protein
MSREHTNIEKTLASYDALLESHPEELKAILDQVGIATRDEFEANVRETFSGLEYQPTEEEK